MKLHETIQNWYLNIIKPLFSLEIETENGHWNEVLSINKTNKTSFYRVQTNSCELLCTENHILITADSQEILAKDSLNCYIKTIHGIETVNSVTKTNITDFAYDVTLDEDTDHLYFANYLLSHNCVVMDEAAFVPNNIASKVFESIYPVISSSKNSRFIMVSTPNGADPNNLYYEIWQKANSNSSAANVEGWKAFRFDWWDVPTRDEKWKEQTLASIGEQRFAQEFGNEFLASTTIKKLIPDDIIERYRIKQTEAKALDKDFFYGKKTQIVNEAQNKLYEFTMWHEFDPKKTYLASGDVAEGVGGDSSVLYVWDVTDLGNIIQCAKFDSNQVSPIEFAFVTVKVLSLYNNPYYVCERNGIGSGYLDAMKITFQYQNFVLEGKNNDCGVFSHVTMKEKACVWAREMMTTAGFGWTFYDKDLVNEMSTFCRKDNKGVRLVYSAMPPAHDDHIMAWIWACWILNPEIVERYFVCCETFKSQLEKIYPKILQPLNEYKAEDIQNVVKDKLYKDFLDFKDEIQHRLGKAMTLEKQAEKNDQYFRPQRDPYFNDFDDGPSWNSGYSGSKLNSTANFPKFYVF